MTLFPRSPPTLSLLFFLFSLFPSSLFSPSLSHSTLRWSSAQDPCYQLDGRPRHCLSEFINAAYSVPVQVSNTLGGPERNVSSLTDLHNPHNLSCWLGEELSGDWTLTVPLGRRFEVTYVSLQFCQQRAPPDSLYISVLKSMDHGRSWRPLQFYSPDCMGSFGLLPRTSALSRHQEMEPFCSDARPLQKQRGGLVLAFSTLDGRPSSSDFDNSPVLQDWVTATDIRVVFHQQAARKVEPSLDEGGVLRWRAGSSPIGRGHGNRAKGGIVNGSTGARLPDFGKKGTSMKMSARDRNDRFDKSWKVSNGRTRQPKDGHNMTQKDESLRRAVALSRKGVAKGKGRGRRRKACAEGRCDWTIEGPERGTTERELRRRRNNRQINGAPRKHWGKDFPSALSLLSRPALSLSDLQVGGRCKCNGHASRCLRDAQGRAVCLCEHHTTGPDCDACEPFYCDRPWQRATPSHPHPCVPCECNGHSSKCRFSMELFQQSGRRSGGICLKCGHHTAGRHCQYCQNGFTRDHSKPLSHRRACQPCQCHPVGAVGQWCNQTSGQCLCRDGVTGLRCNRCAPGYQQGHSPIRPCLRIQELVPTTPVYQPQYRIGEQCGSYCQPSQVKAKMNLETYCLKDYVLKVQVRGMERSGPWWQFSVLVQSVFRLGTARIRRGLQAVWVPDRDLGCGCPALQVGRAFLLVGAEASSHNWGPEERRLVADRSTLALPWREHWNPKLRGFRGQDKRGRCPPRPPRRTTQPPVDHTPPPPTLSPSRQLTHSRNTGAGPATPQVEESDHEAGPSAQTQTPPPQSSYPSELLSPPQHMPPHKSEERGES
ncbi:netrin-1 [Paramormyrops kingsleyae]|uniref:netrin-1 n=1 Tax=Paramormyrops kingsleyae TaxID=1676925 RepID=UPI003B971425